MDETKVSSRLFHTMHSQLAMCVRLKRKIIQQRLVDIAFRFHPSTEFHRWLKCCYCQIRTAANNNKSLFSTGPNILTWTISMSGRAGRLFWEPGALPPLLMASRWEPAAVVWLRRTVGCWTAAMPSFSTPVTSILTTYLHPDGGIHARTLSSSITNHQCILIWPSWDCILIITLTEQWLIGVTRILSAFILTVASSAGARHPAAIV